MAPELIWSPSQSGGPTRLTRFRGKVAQQHGVDLPDYWHFWQWSTSNISHFWEAVWDECEIIGDKGDQWAGGVSSSDDLYPPPMWFQGSKVNYAENLLRHCSNEGGKVAVTSAFEPKDGASLDFSITSVTRSQLLRQVTAAASTLRQAGVRPGDVVAAYSANNIPALVMFLAASAIGAIWCSVAADAAPDAVLDRFETVRPKWIVSVSSVRYNGKRFDHLDKLKQVIERLEASRSSHEQRVEGVVIAPGPDDATLTEDQCGATSTQVQCRSWQSFLASSNSSAPLRYERLDFNAPLWILFSSGTTGKPKAIVHRAGGMLLQLAKEHLLHSGLTKDDVLFQFTTLSWMMSPWGNASLISGAKLVLYDGSPLRPRDDVMLHLAAQQGITVFGTSAAWLDLIKKKEIEPRKTFGGALKIKQVLSTGSPLRADLYTWIREHVGPVLVGSITGGTDICSLFAGNNVDLPVFAGEIQGPNLGIALGVMSTTSGRPVPFPPLQVEQRQQGVNNYTDPETESEEGELVCLAPFPAQPIGFWNQPEERYRSSYYEAYGPGVWNHGDWVSWTPRGGLVMKGRSDGVLNPGGIRFGSAEIYEVLSALAVASSDAQGPAYSKITASLCISLRTPDKSDEVVVLCLVAPEVGDAQWPALVEGVQKEIRSRRSPRHVPRFVVRVSDVPVTVNGKLAEVPAKKREFL